MHGVVMFFRPFFLDSQKTFDLNNSISCTTSYYFHLESALARFEPYPRQPHLHSGCLGLDAFSLGTGPQKRNEMEQSGILPTGIWKNKLDDKPGTSVNRRET